MNSGMDDKEETPLVSVIMNCLNGEEYLRQAINSVMNQSYQNFELIFWDNLSTDSSKKIFEEFKDQRLKYYSGDNYAKLYEARNYAISKSSGDYIAFLDVDDLWDVNKLERQLEKFKNPKVGLVCSNYWIIEDTKEKKIAHKKGRPSGNVLNYLMQDYYVGLLTLIISKKAYESIKNGFNPKYNIIGDVDFVLRALIGCELSYISEPLAYYRIHDNNLSKKLITVVSERRSWELQNKKTEIGNLNGFKSFVMETDYLECIRCIDDRKIRLAFSYFKKLSNFKMKIKALTYLLLPSDFINYLKNVYH